MSRAASPRRIGGGKTIFLRHYRRFNRNGAMLNWSKYFAGKNPLDFCLGIEEMVHREWRLSGMQLRKKQSRYQ